MKKYKAVLFDFDGTLVNTHKFVENYTRRFINGHQVESSDPQVLFGEEGYRRGFKESFPKEIELFDGVVEVLNKLKKEGYKLGVVSTTARERLEEVLRCKGIKTMFDVLIGGEDVSNRKPHPEPVLNALKALGVKPEEALFVGNHQEDIETGLSAGVDTVFFVENEVYYGIIKGWLEENKPVAIIRNLRELPL